MAPGPRVGLVTRRPDIPRRPRAREGTPYDKPRSFRMHDELWTALGNTSQADGLTPSFVLATLAQGFAKGLLMIRNVPEGGGAIHSARISDDVWEAFKDQTQAQGLPASRALGALVGGYVTGEIALHIHVVTSQVPSAGHVRDATPDR